MPKFLLFQAASDCTLKAVITATFRLLQEALFNEISQQQNHLLWKAALSNTLLFITYKMALDDQDANYKLDEKPRLRFLKGNCDIRQLQRQYVYTVHNMIIFKTQLF